MLASLALPGAAAAQKTTGELLVILTDTGERREDLPVATRHPSPAPYLAELTRGFSGRVVRLYPLVQRFAHPERPPQPAYLLLSDNQGGFPRFGLHVDGRRMREAAYVDLHRNGQLTRRFGAMNQIFPHELLHLIVHELAGPMPAEHDNQIHAIGVRTDRATAFSEGFAEHGQVMAIEAPDVSPDTRALVADPAFASSAYAHFEAYRATLTARWAIAPKARMAFPVWFSGSEQVLRYYAVRDNRFAREPSIPARAAADLYSAYLIENTLPGDAAGPPKNAGRLVATEGVVSALFYRLATAAALQRSDAEAAFYRQFGIARGDVDAIDNGYVKLFAAIKAGGYDTVAILDAYAQLFPSDADAMRAIVRDTLVGQDLPRARPIWLRSERLVTGTSLFDQFRALPRAHTFDLNAASRVDLRSVDGMPTEVAAAILAGAPYETVEDVRRVPGAAPLVPTLVRMEAAYRAALEAPDGGSLSIGAVLRPYLWRALIVLGVCAGVSAVAYRAVRRTRAWRVAINGVAAALVGLVAGWTIDPGTGLLAFAAPVGICGLPAAVIALWRTRSFRLAGVALAAWAAAGAVPALIVRPFG